MKLVTYNNNGDSPKVGVLTDDGKHIIDIQAARIILKGEPSPFFDSMLSFLRGGLEARDEAEAVKGLTLEKAPENTLFSPADVTLLAPVPVPESIRDCMAFERHIINTIRKVGLKQAAFVDSWIERCLGKKRSLAYLLNKEWYKRPVYYKSNRFSVVGTGSQVIIPDYCNHFDYELEWGIFIGRCGKNISQAEASDYIGGYTIFNDFSARDIQMKEMRGRLGPAKGKDFETGNAIGPYLVTPDEIKAPYNLIMTASVNGEEWSRGNSKEMHWSFEEMIAYISQSETLYPGEFIGSGTCSGSEGCGCGLEMGRSLKKGDFIKLEVEQLGVLENQIDL